jgi:exopolyphosphatase / guanosine-5'-triphosphate,3'-diphosphate pyrophosphatase
MPGPIAVADIGTNSTRLLIARPSGDGLEELERRTTVTRLGEGVDASGELTPAAMERVHDALAGYAELAREHGATRLIAVATSAVRDAANGEEFRAAVHDRHGFEIRTISGDDEARLTFLGATAGRASEDRTLVIDIGGGSTEFVVGIPGSDPTFHVSTRLGSVRQTERHLTDDPPTPEELAALGAAATEIIEDNVPAEILTAVDHAIAVAGTPTSIAAIDQALDPYDPAKVHGYPLPLPVCEGILERLAALPVAQRREVVGLHPERAPTIVAGVAILVEAMRAFGLEAVETSEADILQGAALQAFSAG